MRFVEHKFLSALGEKRGYIGPAMDVDTKSFDDDSRSVDWIMSEEVADRASFDRKGKPAGDIVRVDGMDLRSFAANPIVLQFHNYNAHSVGIVRNPRVEDKRLKGRVEFNPASVGNRDADIFWGQTRAGHHKAGSIGFIATKEKEMARTDDDKEDDRYGYRPRFFEKSHLLEYSMVPVPMLQTALVSPKGIEEYDFKEICRDILGHNPHSWTRVLADGLIRRFSEHLIEAGEELYGKSAAGEPATADEETPPNNTPEPVPMLPERKSIEELVAAAVADARSRYSL